jgi:hypothetical protein
MATEMKKAEFCPLIKEDCWKEDCKFWTSIPYSCATKDCVFLNLLRNVEHIKR